MFILFKNSSLCPINSANILQSGSHSIIIKTGFITITLFHSDILPFYNDVLFFYDHIINSFNHFSSSKMMNPLSLQLYNNYLNMATTNVVEVVKFASSSSTVKFSFFSPMQFSHHLVHLGTNIHVTTFLYNMLLFVLVPVGLTVAVNIHTILTFFSRILNIFFHFINSFIKKCGNYYDVVRGTMNGNSLNNSTNNNDKSNSKKMDSSGNRDSNQNGGDEDGDKRGKDSDKGIYIVSESQLIQLLVLIVYVYYRIRDLRLRGMNQDQLSFFGDPGTPEHPNIRVTLAQIIRYSIANPEERVDDLNTTLSSLLTPYAFERMTLSRSLRVLFSGVLKGSNLNNALVGGTSIRSFMNNHDICPNYIKPSDMDVIMRFIMERFLQK